MSTIEDVSFDPTPNPEWQEIINMGKKLNYYGVPIIVVFGLFGNITTFIIMSRQGFNQKSASIYFRTLAVLDCLVIVNHMTYLWAGVHYDATGKWWMLGYVSCKITFMTFAWPIGASGMVLVALTFERFLVTAIPLKTKRYCTKRNAKIVCATINIVIILIWAVPMFIVHKDIHCADIEIPGLQFMGVYGKWIYITIYTYIPTPVIFILNFFLIYKLVQARRTRLMMTESTLTAHDPNKQYQRLAVMTITVSLAYLIFTVPTTTMNALANFMDISQMSTYVAWMIVGDDISQMIRLLNHSTNFVLYLLSNTRIRSEFMSMISQPFKKSDKPPNVTIYTLSTNSNQKTSAE